MIENGQAAPRHTPPASRLLHHDGELMTELMRAARAAWPEVELAPEVFTSYLESRLPAGAESELALRHMRTSDLYLACACALGDPRALACFEQSCLSVIDEALPRVIGLESDLVDDLKQEIRRRLLVGGAGVPRIAEFSGRGELRRWVRVIAVREALAMRRRARREVPMEEGLLERALLSMSDPETDYLKTFYRSEFASAIQEAMTALGAREQTLLRQSFVDGLSIDELGSLHGIHRATAARRLARAQAALSKETRAVLMRRLEVQSAELRSILRLIRSGLHVSLRALFRPQTGRRRVPRARRLPAT